MATWPVAATTAATIAAPSHAIQYHAGHQRRLRNSSATPRQYGRARMRYVRRAEIARQATPFSQRQPSPAGQRRRQAAPPLAEY